MKNHQKTFTVKALNRFLEETFEIAFGDDAIDKYMMYEVVDRLKEFSMKAHYVEEMIEDNDYAEERYVYWLQENYPEGEND